MADPWSVDTGKSTGRVENGDVVDEQPLRTWWSPRFNDSGSKTGQHPLDHVEISDWIW